MEIDIYCLKSLGIEETKRIFSVKRGDVSFHICDKNVKKKKEKTKKDSVRYGPHSGDIILG